MRCLLDKVTARCIIQGLLKLAENQNLTSEELFALDLFSRATPQTLDLFIAPPTESVLQKLAQITRYSALIHYFLNRVDTAQPTHYFKRWARRLRDYSFTPEDAVILALATFSTNQDDTILGMQFVATYDQPMIITG